MNVLDYAIRVGTFFRKTEEGRALLEAKKSIEEKYITERAIFADYLQLVSEKETQFYFFAWQAAFNAFMSVIDDKEFEHRQLFLKTAELIKDDEDVKELIDNANKVGDIFNIVNSLCLTGEDIEIKVPKEWKYKIRNAISDVQLAVQRTLMASTIASYYGRSVNLINNKTTKMYLDEREIKQYLPFSSAALNCAGEYSDMPEEEKMLYEKMFLVREAISKGIFYGFWGKINELRLEDIIDGKELEQGALKEVVFSHVNSSFSFGSSWLYKIWSEGGYSYLMAHKREVTIMPQNEGKTTVTGIIYPTDDRRLFDDETA